MIFNEELALKNGAKKVKNGDSFWAWLLPQEDGFRKMVAYARNDNIFWIHTAYQSSQNNKKKK